LLNRSLIERCVVQSKYIRFETEADSAKNLWKLLADKWQFPHPSLVLSVAGGPVFKNFRHKYFLQALTKLVTDTSKLAMFLYNQDSVYLGKHVVSQQ